MKLKGFEPPEGLTFGEIFEVRTSKGFFYIQYCNFDRPWGCLMRKIKGKFSKPQTEINKVSQLNTAYYFFTCCLLL